ncbi:protein of unknown function [Streptomyces sp. KY75]|nr:protein of unknown function [Streptomyces sp. KY75]CAD5982993.1 protein of unknown function [Streptomyces sp. KY70]
MHPVHIDCDVITLSESLAVVKASNDF